MGDTITRIDDSTGQGAVRHFRRCPGGGECENGLDGDIETSAVKGLEEDLGRVLAILGGVQGLGYISSCLSSGSVYREEYAYRFGQEEVVVFGFDSEVFEDGVGPESFHVVLCAYTMLLFRQKKK